MKNKYQAARIWGAGWEPYRWQENYLGMKVTKAIRRQAETAERVAATTADEFVANQMRSLAQAFRSQADVMKKKKKKKKK